MVVSPIAYNRKVGLAICCPVTSRVKGYVFEVLVPPGLAVDGAILADQVKNLDWRARQTTLIGKLPPEATRKLLQKLATLITE